MNKQTQKILAFILGLIIVAAGYFLDLGGEENNLVNNDTPDVIQSNLEENEANNASETVASSIDENGSYSTKEDVALYLHTYNQLPTNFITKNDASDLGWDNSDGNLWEVTDKMSIGGNRFGNREGLLPDAEGRQWYECDIDYEGGYRNAKRIVYSNDGLIYYTDDHYESFVQLY